MKKKSVFGKKKTVRKALDAVEPEEKPAEEPVETAPEPVEPKKSDDRSTWTRREKLFRSK